jgi:hypothetical protein
MKKILLLSLISGMGLHAQAQSDVRLGIKAGATLSSFSGGDVSDAKYKVGFNGGLTATFGLNDKFSFQPELLYSMKGVKGEESETSTMGGDTYFASEKVNITLHYIDLPLLFKLKSNQIFFEAGPQLGFLIGQKTTDEGTLTYTSGGTTTTQNFSESSTSTDGLRKVDIGYVLGVGYQLSEDVSLGLRYNRGFTSLDKGGNSKAYNSAFQLQLGYLFAK